MSDVHSHESAATDKASATESPSVAVQDSHAVPEDTGAAQDHAIGAQPAGTASDEVRAERDRLKEQLLRTAAELDNLQKRQRRELDEAARRGKEAVLRDILPVIDNLERAVAASGNAVGGQAEVSAIVEGVRMVLTQFGDAASSLGLERVAAVGHKFDPAVHEAVQQQESQEHAPGTVVAEVVPGYRFEGRLLRAAMVVVAKA